MALVAGVIVGSLLGNLGGTLLARAFTKSRRTRRWAASLTRVHLGAPEQNSPLWVASCKCGWQSDPLARYQAAAKAGMDHVGWTARLEALKAQRAFSYRRAFYRSTN